MSFCQACGARNADDARFCNACGARIVKGVPSGAGPAPGAATPAAPSSDAGATRPARSSGSGAGSAPVENVWAMQSQAGAPSPASTGTSTTTGSTTSTGSSNTFSNQTLAGVGIPSQRHTYATLASIALGFLALGILLAWLVMRGGEHETTAEASVPTVPGEVAPSIPEGVEVPDDGAFVEGGRGGGSRGGGGRTGGSTGGGSTGGATGGSGGAVAGGSGGSAGGTGATGGTGSGGGTSATGGSGGATGGSGSGGTAGGGTGGTGSAGGTGGSGTGGTGSAGGTGGSGTGGSGGSGSTGGTGGSGTGGGERDWAAMGETVGEEPPDYDVSLYVSNVRRFIRNNYARQASSCFSRASAAGGSAITGRVVIGFTISATGGTENVHVVRNEPGIDSLGSCLVNRVDSWDLPAPPRREPLSLEMPFSP